MCLKSHKENDVDIYSDGNLLSCTVKHVYEGRLSAVSGYKFNFGGLSQDSSASAFVYPFLQKKDLFWILSLMLTQPLQ